MVVVVVVVVVVVWTVDVLIQIFEDGITLSLVFPNGVSQ